MSDQGFRPQQAPPGWYAAPDDPSADRWWDGYRWAADRRARSGLHPSGAMHSPAPHGPASPHHAAALPHGSSTPHNLSATAPRGNSVGSALLVLAIVLGVVAVFVNMQPVSLLTGTSTLYFGVVLAAISLVLVLVVKGRMGFRTLALVLVVFCSVVVAANTVYVQVQYNQFREQLFRPFGE